MATKWFQIAFPELYFSIIIGGNVSPIPDKAAKTVELSPSDTVTI